MNNTADYRRALTVTEAMRADFAALGSMFAAEVAAIDSNLVTLRAEVAEHERADAMAERAFAQACCEGF